MAVHRCVLPEPFVNSSPRVTWTCLEKGCGATYHLSKRWIGREMRQCWVRETYTPLSSRRLVLDGDDGGFDRVFRWAFPVALTLGILGAVVSLALYAGAAAWVWSLVP